MSERITEDEERRIREAYEAADSAEGHAPHWWYVRALFGEIEAVRAERDEAEGAALVHAEDAGMYRARAEAAEAKLDEQIEAAIALRHDLDTLRDLYGAAEARITAARDGAAGDRKAADVGDGAGGDEPGPEAGVADQVTVAAHRNAGKTGHERVERGVRGAAGG